MGNRFKVYEKEIQGVSLIGDGEMADRIRALVCALRQGTAAGGGEGVLGV